MTLSKEKRTMLIYGSSALLAMLSFLVAIDQSSIWSLTAAMINIFMIAAVLLFAYIKSDKNIAVSNCYIISFVAVFSYGIQKMILLIMLLQNIVPQDHSILSFLSLITVLIFITTMIVFLHFQFSKWNSIQFTLDTVTIGFLFVMQIWILFFDRMEIVLERFINAGWVITLTLALDILTVVFIMVWFFSIRKGKIPFFIRIIAMSIFTYCAFDLYFCSVAVLGRAVDPHFAEIAYLISLHLLGLGAIWKTILKRDQIFDTKFFENVGTRPRWPYLLLFPLVTLIFNGITFGEGLIFFSVIMIHTATQKYVQMAIQNERLLNQEMQLNQKLELRVEEQVKELTFLANQDAVTRLFNRGYFINMVKHSINSCLTNQTVAIFLFDIDRFKIVNDQFGHDIGDRVLVAIAERLVRMNTRLHCDAVVSRLGGDEFALLLHGNYSLQKLKDCSANLTSICNQPIVLDEQSLHITISVGVAIYDEHCEDAAMLLKHADIAMYRAKSQGYNRIVFFDPFHKKETEKQQEIELMLKKSDVINDFELFYQPQFRLSDMRLVGAECLLRWHSKEHGYIPPNEFIPIAEQLDHMIRIGRWVLENASKQISKWNKKFETDLMVGINISPTQFKDTSIIELLHFLIREYNLKTNWIDLEITENIILKNGLQTSKIFDSLRELDLSVSIDDFGSGYSSWGYLNQFQFDRIKLDKSIIDAIATTPSGEQVALSIISMAKAMNKTTIAEGVENQETLDTLIKLGCDQVQGYFTGRPVPARIFEERFITEHQRSQGDENNSAVCPFLIHGPKAAQNQS